MVTVPEGRRSRRTRRPPQLALSGTWHDVGSDDLAVFECLEADVDYNVAGQNGFLGTGGGEFGFLHSDPLDIVVEIHSDATDIRFTSTETHDLDLGPVRTAGRHRPDRRQRPHRGSDADADHPLRDARAERRRRIDLRPEGGLRDGDQHHRHPDHPRLLRLRRHAAVGRARRPRGLGDGAPALRLRDGRRRRASSSDASTATRPSQGCRARASSRGTSARRCSTCRAG